MAQVERREPEADDVGCAKIADHTAFDQCLHQAVTARMRERDVAATALEGARTCKPQTRARPERLDPRNEKFGQHFRFGANQSHVDTGDRLERAIERGKGDHRRRTAAVACHAARRPVVVVKVERRVMPHPAGQRRSQRFLQVPAHVQERRCTGSAVEIFVGTAHGEIDLRRSELERQCADTVRQVPQHACPGRVRTGRDRGKVEQLRGLVVHMSEHDQERRGVDRGFDLIAW